LEPQCRTCQRTASCYKIWTKENINNRTLWMWHNNTIAPKWTGKCGAFATNPPVLSNKAQEKSSRSLMFVETDVRCSVRPFFFSWQKGNEKNERKAKLIFCYHLFGDTHKAIREHRQIDWIQLRTKNCRKYFFIVHSLDFLLT
jgi:hypothetical protein